MGVWCLLFLSLKSIQVMSSEFLNKKNEWISYRAMSSNATKKEAMKAYPNLKYLGVGRITRNDSEVNTYDYDSHFFF